MTKKHRLSRRIAVFVKRDTTGTFELDQPGTCAYHLEKATFSGQPLPVERSVAERTESIFISYYSV